MFALIFDSVGAGEWFVLLAVVLIVVGPKRLPETARKLGRISARIRRVADGFWRQVMEMDSEPTQSVRGEIPVGHSESEKGDGTAERS